MSTPSSSTPEPRRAHNRRLLPMVAGVALIPTLLVTLVGLIVVPWWAAVPIGLAVGVGVAWWWYHSAPRRVLAAIGAEECEEADQPRLFNVLEGLCVVHGMHQPSLYLVPSATRDALAVGHGEGDAAVVVTTGLIESLSLLQLEGALARVLGRIRSGRMASTTLASSLVGGLGSRWVVRLAGPLDDFGEDLAAVDLTRYPPGLIGAYQQMAAGPPAPASWGRWAALWMGSDSGNHHDSATSEAHASQLGTVGIPGRLGLSDRIGILREL